MSRCALDQQDRVGHGWCLHVQVTQSLPDIAFLNCRPSVIAAAIVYAERRSRGIIPFWPSMLSKLSAYQVALPGFLVLLHVSAPLCRPVVIC